MLWQTLTDIEVRQTLLAMLPHKLVFWDEINLFTLKNSSETPMEEFADKKHTEAGNNPVA